MVGVDVGGIRGASVGEVVVWLLKYWPATDLGVLGLGHEIVKGGSGRRR